MLEVYLPAVCILIALSALFSGSETALFTLSRVQLKILEEKGGKVDKAIARLLREPKRVLNTLLLCNLFVNTVLSALLSEVFIQLFGAAGLGYAVVVSTALLLLFGEITPKVISLSQYMAVARLAVYPITFCCWLTTPFRLVLRLVSNCVLRLMGLPLEKADRLTRDSYFAALNTGRHQGAINVKEADIIRGICVYRGLTAADVMVPRTSMLSAEENLTLLEALNISVLDPCPWLPIYRGSQDHVVGVLDLSAANVDWRSLKGDVTLKEMMASGSPFIKEPSFIPGSKPMDAMLEHLKTDDSGFVLVLDEYGGIDGAVMRSFALDTMLGGFIGFNRNNVHARPNGDLIVPGSARLDDLNWECSLAFPTDADTTLAGYIERQLGEIPEAGRSFEALGYEITILRRSGVRLDMVRLRPLKEGDRK